jgi:hypothetical protein
VAIVYLLAVTRAVVKTLLALQLALEFINQSLKESKTMNRKTFLRNDKTGLFYCNDGLFRQSVHFGNVSGCLKFWKKAGFAKLKARKLGLSEWSIFHVYPGDEVDSVGNVIRQARNCRHTIRESKNRFAS